MSTVYSVSRDTIITTALRKLQVIELGVTPDADTITNAAQSLNIMIKAWQSNGIKLWTIDEYTLPLVTNQNAYTISPAGPDLVGNKPLKVIQAWLRNTQVTPNIDTPLQILSKQEYNILGSKQSTGTANSIFYDVRATTGILYVYLMPDANTAAHYQLHFVAQRPMTDIATGTDIPDFPTEWQQALIWGLADELAIEYGCHINQRQEIAVKADKYRRELEDFDVEYVSTLFSPDMRMQGR
jgi:hypothetical protein